MNANIPDGDQSFEEVLRIIDRIHADLNRASSKLDYLNALMVFFLVIVLSVIMLLLVSP